MWSRHGFGDDVYLALSFGGLESLSFADIGLPNSDPSEPASKKRAKIEEAGKTPLDAADK